MANSNDFSIFGPKLLADLEYMQFALHAHGQPPGRALDAIEAVETPMSGVVDTKEAVVRQMEDINKILVDDMKRFV